MVKLNIKDVKFLKQIIRNETTPPPEQIWRIRREKPILVADFWNDGYVVEGCLEEARRYFQKN